MRLFSPWYPPCNPPPASSATRTLRESKSRRHRENVTTRSFRPNRGLCRAAFFFLLLLYSSLAKSSARSVQATDPAQSIHARTSSTARRRKKTHPCVYFVLLLPSPPLSTHRPLITSSVIDAVTLTLIVARFSVLACAPWPWWRPRRPGRASSPAGSDNQVREKSNCGCGGSPRPRRTGWGKGHGQTEEEELHRLMPDCSQ